MIDARQINEIIATYHKHGWVLRRVLLSPALTKTLDKYREALFGDVPVIASETDAAWFSRPPKAGGVAWEIRYLGDVPFALLEGADESDPGFEDVLSSVEMRLRDAIAAKASA